jgi:hypothetical protein
MHLGGTVGAFPYKTAPSGGTGGSHRDKLGPFTTHLTATITNGTFRNTVMLILLGHSHTKTTIKMKEPTVQ